MNQLKNEFLYEHPLYKEYACDEQGNVYSLNYNRTGKIKKIKPWMVNGYLKFFVYKDGKRVAQLVNRFVWECIKGEIPTTYHVDHLDFNRQNNRIDNLLARPASENIARVSEGGRKARSEATKKACSKSVIQLDKQGNLIAEFSSLADAERQTGVFKTNISKCCIGKYKSAGGFKWKYAS